MKKITTKIKTKIIIRSLFVIILFLLVFIGWKYFYPDKGKVDMLDVAERERVEVLAKVGAHIVLPKDEVPTLATVSDPEQLKKYPFFSNAEKGDKVLIYSLAKKAILYRPTGDKIVEIAPIITKTN
jgi:heme/copper-type cytochrome/quinol oxidase subunit 2